MPNHVTHRVRISGPAEEIARFKEIAIRSGQEEVTDWATGGKRMEKFTNLDFNAFIPMPEILKDSESSSSVDDGLAILEWEARQRGEAFEMPTRRFATSRRLEEMLQWPWVVEAGIKTPAELRDKLEERNHQCIPKARAALKAYQECGHSDWYSWSCDNWGTKWNAYSYQEVDNPDCFEFQFDTAWSPPEPVFRKWGEMFPTLTIDIVAFDEGWGFAYDVSIHNGEWGGGEVDATDDLYELVYGYPPEKYDDVSEQEAEAMGV